MKVVVEIRASDAGWLHGPTIDVDGVAFQAGDAVMMLRNNRKLGVRNGNRGTVIDVDSNEQTMRVSLARGQVTLPAAYLQAGNVGHAYAMTINKAHGMTCDRTMTLGNDQPRSSDRGGARRRNRRRTARPRNPPFRRS